MQMKELTSTWRAAARMFDELFYANCCHRMPTNCSPQQIMIYYFVLVHNIFTREGLLIEG